MIQHLKYEKITHTPNIARRTYESELEGEKRTPVMDVEKSFSMSQNFSDL